MSATMKIVTRCERVQPVVTGVDKRGEFVWEGREMPDWQKLMFPVRYIGDFLAHWMKARLTAAGMEMDETMPSMDISKRRQYGKAKPQARQGD